MTKTTYTTKRVTVVETQRNALGHFLKKTAPRAKQAPPAKPVAKNAEQPKAALPDMPKKFAIKEIDIHDDICTVIVQCDLPGVGLLFEAQKFIQARAKA